jgi:alkanesulfonate monooxygenase SsuD/methylene tetrahydromethanopterin reductase-like flavin-dependent oxidoreductase (luciferase family)
VTGTLEIAVTAWRTQNGWTADSLCGQAEQAEALGFHSYWLPENHFGDRRAIPSPLTLLAAAAARTTRLKLGTTSYLLPIRHPIQAAEEVAVVDQLSGGRLILGIGRGIQDSVFEVFGLPSKDKRARFKSNLDTMLSAWRGEPVFHDPEGQASCLAPLPVQQPHPPLWVAAFGPLALKQVGGLGLPYLSSPIEPLDALVGNYALHREAAEEAGHTLERTVPVMRTVFISDDSKLVSNMKETLASALPPRLQRHNVATHEWAIIGDRHYARDRITEYVEKLSITHLIGGGRLPAVDNASLLQSHEWLAEIADLI